MDNLNHFFDISNLRSQQVDSQELMDRKLKILSKKPECSELVLGFLLSEREYSRGKQRQHVTKSIFRWPSEFANYTETQIKRQEQVINMTSCQELLEIIDKLKSSTEI